MQEEVFLKFIYKNCNSIFFSSYFNIYCDNSGKKRKFSFGKMYLVASSPGYFTLFGSRGGGPMPPLAWPRGGILKSRTGIRFFTNNMIFLEYGVIALFEAFYMFRDHNHVKMKF